MAIIENSTNKEPKFGDGPSKINNKSENLEKINADGPMFKDLGGMDELIEDLKMKVIVPLYNPHVLRHLGVKPPLAGILLHRPSGCGKTTLAHAIGNESGVPFYKISATEVASYENISELFSKAYRTTPSIVFIHEIDAVASKRENLKTEMERCIVAQLMTCMSNRGPGHVLVIGATNRLDAVDPAFRRSSRFEREILVGVPDVVGRAEILSVLTSKLKVEDAFSLADIARSTDGFVGADLAALANKAGRLAMNRKIEKRTVVKRRNGEAVHKHKHMLILRKLLKWFNLVRDSKKGFLPCSGSSRSQGAWICKGNVADAKIVVDDTKAQ